MPSQPMRVPPDDLSRHLTVARPDRDQSLPHIGLVGDTYTILVTGDQVEVLDAVQHGELGRGGDDQAGDGEGAELPEVAASWASLRRTYSVRDSPSRRA